MKNKSIIKLLLNDDKVNDYTKLYIILYYKDIYKDYYISNQLIMNRLKLSKVNASRLINEFKKNNVIKLYYKGSKRYFEFINVEEEENKNILTKEEQKEINDILEYDWLNNL